MFVRYRGKTKLMYFKKGDTTRALKAGGLVQLDSGLLHHNPANDSTNHPIGVCRFDVALTDTSSWVGAPMVPVEVPVESAVEWLIDVDSDAGAADTDVGCYVGMDTLTDSLNDRYVDMTDTVMRRVYVTGVQSASKIIGILGRTALTNPAGKDTVDTGA